MSVRCFAASVARGCFLLAFCLGAAAPAARADVLLFYDFNDASDPALAFDLSGTGNDGTIGAAQYSEPGLGRSGEATDRAIDFLTGFDGAYIDVPTAIEGAFDTIVGNDSATILMWVFGGELQPQNHFAFWFAEGEGDPRQLASHIPWSDGTIYFDVSGCCDATQRIQQGEPDFTKWKGEWNHYAFVKDVDTTRIYQNGEVWLEGTGKAPLASIHTVRFGSGGGAPGNLSYNGLMDDIGVWDEALTQDDILNVMESGLLKPAIARMTATPTEGPVPLKVAFDAAGSTTPEGTIESYTWAFGDGETATGLKVEHTYARRGVYKARLTVKDSRGARGSASQTITATFACGSVAPAYTSVDVGGPAIAGCARREGNDFVLFAGGQDIRKTADQFHFVYKEEAGDVTLTAQVKDIVPDNRLAGRSGLMLRDSTASDAAFGSIHLASSLGGLRPTFLGRAAQGLNVGAPASSPAASPPDAWLRLERKGAEITGYFSASGAEGSFTKVGSVVLTSPADKMLGGLALTSADINAKGFAIEARFFIPPSGPTGTPFHRGDVDDNALLQLTDAVRILNFLFTGGPEPTCFDSADADDNGLLQLTDAVRILSFLFLGAIPPAPPGPPGDPCGADVNAENPDLGCAAYTSC